MTELNYKTFGNGPALIILHGLFGSLDNWQSLAKKYAEHFSVFIPDLRNHGKSPHTQEKVTYPSMAGDVLGFMEQHGISRASVIGHSMGGKVAMQLALDHPDRMEKLVVSDMAPVQYSPHHEEVFRAMDSLDLVKLDNRNDADEQLKKFIPDYSVRQFLLKSLDRTSPSGGYEWKFNLEVLRRDYQEILSAVHGDFPFDGDTLFIHGGLSPYLKPEHTQMILSLFPRAEFFTVEGSGHWIHAEKPLEFFNATMKFLN